MSKKAQASFEYLAVFSIALIILIPMVYMFYSYSADSSEKITTSQIQVIGNDIVNAAESVYYMGKFARLTLEETMPDGINNIIILTDWDNNVNEIIFNLSSGAEIAFFSAVNINASINEGDYSPGLKYIQLETRNTSDNRYVQIDIS